MGGLSGSPSAMRRSNRRRVSTRVWDPYDESVRPQLRGKLTHEVLRQQVHQLRARMGHSEWCALTLKGAREAIAAHMRLPIDDLKQHQPTIRYLVGSGTY